MNILFGNRYFRRECLAQTWKPKCLARHLPAKSWYFNYVNYVEDFDIIWKLCVIGNLQNLKKVKKNVYCKTMYVNIIDCPNSKLVYKNSNYCSYKIIDIELIVSSFYGHLTVVQYLIKQCADIHTKNDFALRMSAGKGYLPVVQYLVEKGADIHAYNDDALRESAGNGHLPVVQYLVEQGADIHADCDDALSVSIESGHFRVAQYLVEEGKSTFLLTDRQLRKLKKNYIYPDYPTKKQLGFMIKTRLI